MTVRVMRSHSREKASPTPAKKPSVATRVTPPSQANKKPKRKSRKGAMAAVAVPPHRGGHRVLEYSTPSCAGLSQYPILDTEIIPARSTLVLRHNTYRQMGSVRLQNRAATTEATGGHVERQLPSSFNNPQDAAPYQALTCQQSLKRQFRERLAAIEAANNAEANTIAVEKVNNGIDDHHFDDVDAPFDLAALAQLDTVDILTVAQNVLLSSATSQTPAYVKRKASNVEQFFKILQQDLHLRRLANLLPHPDFDNQQIWHLYLAYRQRQSSRF